MLTIMHSAAYPFTTISHLPNLCMGTSGTPCNCRSFECVLSLNQVYLTTMYRSTIPIPSDLSNQSALGLGLGLGFDLALHYFSIFHEKSRKWAPYPQRISRKVTFC